MNMLDVERKGGWLSTVFFSIKKCKDTEEGVCYFHSYENQQEQIIAIIEIAIIIMIIIKTITIIINNNSSIIYNNDYNCIFIRPTV